MTDATAGELGEGTDAWWQTHCKEAFPECFRREVNTQQSWHDPGKEMWGEHFVVKKQEKQHGKCRDYEKVCFIRGQSVTWK